MSSNKQLVFPLMACELPASKCNCLSHNTFLTRAGYAEFDARVGGLTGAEECVRLDTFGSVSGSRRDETSMIWPTDEETDEQFRRILELEEAV